jgi:hypothetical protein
MWSLFPTNLIISQNVLAWSSYALETYSNAEVLAINQDPLGIPAQRIVGGDLTFPCGSSGGLAEVSAVACNPADPSQKWSYGNQQISSALYPGVLDAFECGTSDGTQVFVFPNDNGSGTCGGKNQKWTWSPSGKRARRRCSDLAFTGCPGCGSMDVLLCSGCLSCGGWVGAMAGTVVNANSGSCLDVFE